MRFQFRFQFVIALLCLGVFHQLVAGQENNWRAQRMQLERVYGEELQEIADWSRENKISQQVEQTFKLYQNRDLNRQYIFLPTELSMPTGPDDVLGEWLKKINAAKVKHGDRIFELAKKASKAKHGTAAFQFLHDVIHYNRDHEEVRKILGHTKKKDGGWEVMSDKIRVKESRRDHELLKWPKKSFIEVTTPHFEIASNAGEARTRYLAEKLERWHLVWRQVFFEYWSSPANVERWINGKGSARTPGKRFRVAFFKDRNDYLTQLQPLVPGIEKSNGYYSPDQRISFFYDGESRAEDTWRHELTHQLFREASGAKGTNLESGFIWLDEGIATYFESLTDFGRYVTLGGFESRRLQYSRIRKVLEQFPMPMEELSSLGRTGLQQHPDMERLYSVMAGFTDMVVNDGNGAYEKKLTAFLSKLYKGRIRKGDFEKILGRSYKDWDERYEGFLVGDSTLVEKHLSQPESRTELSLPGFGLQTPAYEKIGQCVNLNWLDLSRNRVSGAQFQLLKDCKDINQLILTECQFDDASMQALAQFSKLDDMDLSGSNIQDSQLASLKNLKSLRALRLAATNITNQGLVQLAGIPNLQTLDVSRTRVTPAGIASLKAQRPNLVVNQ